MVGPLKLSGRRREKVLLCKLRRAKKRIVSRPTVTGWTDPAALASVLTAVPTHLFYSEPSERRGLRPTDLPSSRRRPGHDSPVDTFVMPRRHLPMFASPFPPPFLSPPPSNRTKRIRNVPSPALHCNAMREACGKRREGEKKDREESLACLELGQLDKVRP